MRKLFYSLFLFGLTFILLTVVTSVLASDTLSTYVGLLAQRESKVALLADIMQSYQRGLCDQPGFKNDGNCPTIRKRIKEINAQIRKLDKKISRHAERHPESVTQYQSATSEQQATSASSSLTTSQIDHAQAVATCLGSIGASNEVIENLYSMAMNILRRERRSAYLTQMKSRAGFSNQECGSHAEVNCWMEEYGSLYYVAEGHIRISESCLIRKQNALCPDGVNSNCVGAGQQRFPSDPRSYLSAAHDVTKAVSAKGCLKRYNATWSQEIKRYLETYRPIVNCEPAQESPTDSHCAHAQTGAALVTMVAPNNCQNLSRTLLHELMHAQGSHETMHTQYHNTGSCAQYDGIYYCSEKCFPNPPSKKHHRYGCQQCMDDAHQSSCDSLPSDYDTTYQQCIMQGGIRY